MRLICHIATGALFALHALLGCGLHHLCQHGAAVVSCTVSHDGGHRCHAHHHGNDEVPAEHDPAPADLCQHGVCSYVKAETTPAPALDIQPAWIAPVVADVSLAPHVAATAEAPLCNADLSTTQIYVWNCALII